MGGGQKRRPLLSFSVVGLSSRDEVLFKSLVRLLQDSTKHTWIYRPDGADLSVVGSFEPDGPASRQCAGATLWVGNAAADHQFKIALPLHFKDLEFVLNAVGAWLDTQSTQRQVAPATRQLAPGTMVHLLRWPPTSVLTSPERAKASAIMLKGPIELDVLARRSGMTRLDCELFVSDLPHLQCTLKASELASAAEGSVVLAEGQFGSESNGAHIAHLSQPGRRSLLDRIRRKLGLKL